MTEEIKATSKAKAKAKAKVKKAPVEVTEVEETTTETAPAPMQNTELDMVAITSQSVEEYVEDLKEELFHAKKRLACAQHQVKNPKNNGRVTFLLQQIAANNRSHIDTVSELISALS